MVTGVAPGVWAAEGERAIVTAIAVLNQQNGKPQAAGGPQMSG
ncbi:MAG TPA: hypothetical protein VHA75_06950 [Rugosimonospora sp.]|nr:hypothetical protein [Rugosimonospora sp.]